jgi:hypothetical protein
MRKAYLTERDRKKKHVGDKRAQCGAMTVNILKEILTNAQSIRIAYVMKREL